MKIEQLEKVRKICEGELTILRESIKQIEGKSLKTQSNINSLKESGQNATLYELDSESERLDGVLEDLLIKENEFKAKIEEINFVSASLFSESPIPDDSTLGHVVDEYGLLAEALEVHRSNIVTSLINKGIEIPADSTLGTVPLQIVKLPTLGGDLSISAPNVGAMVDTKDQEYDVTKIIKYVTYDESSPKYSLLYEKTTEASVLGIALDNKGFSYLATGSKVIKVDSDGVPVWEFTGHSAVVTDVKVDSNSFVYSANRDGTVRKISSDGMEVWSFTAGDSFTEKIFVDPNGFVYSINASKQIRKISPDGKKVWMFVATNRPLCICVDSDGFVIYGTSAYELIKCNSDGSRIWTYKDVNNAYVLCVGTTSDNTIYYGNDSRLVTAISSDGRKVWTSSLTFGNINSLVIDENDYIFYYVNNNYIVKIDSEHKQVFAVSYGDTSGYIAVNNGFFVLGTSYSRYLKYKDKYTISTEMDLKRR